MPDFVMPSLGADMDAGTLVKWRKQPGDFVHRGDIIAEVETDKGVIEVECFAEGNLQAWLVEPGQKVPVGTRLATLGDVAAAPMGAQPELEPSAEKAPPLPVPETVSVMLPPAPSALPGAPPLLHGTPSMRRRWRESHAHASLPVPPPPSASRLRASPLARRLASERGVSLDAVEGTGPSGSIVAGDVMASVQAQREQPRAAPETNERMRHAIGQTMSRSKREIPHYYLSHLVDVQRISDWLKGENEGRPPSERLLMGALFVRAVGLALGKVPELNAHFIDGHIVPLTEVEVGVAVSLRNGGLVAPVIRSASRTSLEDLSTAFKDVVSRARAGALRSSEMRPGSITVTSLGERGVDCVWPIIIPPQVAMVGFGTLSERPMVVDGELAVRTSVVVTLAADHRVSDGHRGGLFLAALARILQEEPTHGT